MFIDKTLKILKQKSVTLSVIFKEITDSTNEEVKSFLKQGDNSPIIVADCQRKGKGRGNNVWFSPAGVNLYFSIPIRIGVVESGRLYPLATGVAIYATLSRWTSSKLCLKWPNDVLANGKKISGILCETTKSYAGDYFVIIGVGINVNCDKFPPELRRKATSLKLIENRTFPREEILAGAISEIVANIALLSDEAGRKTIIEKWRSGCKLWGRRVKVDGITGVMHNISADGGVLIKDHEGKDHIVYSGTLEIK